MAVYPNTFTAYRYLFLPDSVLLGGVGAGLTTAVGLGLAGVFLPGDPLAVTKSEKNAQFQIPQTPNTCTFFFLKDNGFPSWQWQLEVHSILGTAYVR